MPLLHREASKQQSVQVKLLFLLLEGLLDFFSMPMQIRLDMGSVYPHLQYQPRVSQMLIQTHVFYLPLQ